MRGENGAPLVVYSISKPQTLGTIILPDQTDVKLKTLQIDQSLFLPTAFAANLHFDSLPCLEDARFDDLPCLKIGRYLWPGQREYTTNWRLEDGDIAAFEQTLIWS